MLMAPQKLVLLLFSAAFAEVKPSAGVETGEIGKAAFRIDIPASPNGQLIVYCHGYGGPSQYDKSKPPSALVKAFLDAGYAVAQSGYSKKGWALEQAIGDSEALRAYYEGKYGKPKRTWVTGHSMGGAITVAVIEMFPRQYDGALQMCGPVGASLDFLKRKMFDTLAVYDYYFPDMIVSPVAPVEWDAELPLRIQKEATSYPERLEAFQKWSGLKTEVEVGQVVAFFTQVQRELIERTGGNPFDNRNTVYQGSTDDGKLNRGVKRFAATPKAADYLRRHYTPSGELKQPMLSLHTIHDPLVPAWAANAYGDLLESKGGSGLYVQRFVSRNGHCAFTPEETMNAFRDLVAWKESGQAPASGEQK